MPDRIDLLHLPRAADKRGGKVEEPLSRLIARGHQDAAGIVVRGRQPTCLAAVQVKGIPKDKGWGLIDRSGAFVIPPEFQWATGKFSEGLTQVKLNGEDRFIDAAGTLVGPPGLRAVTDFRRGYAWARKADKFGLLDNEGSLVFLGDFDEVRDERSECVGRYAVRVGSKWGFIDATGNLVIPLQFDWVGYFSEGCVNVSQNGKSGLIDAAGNRVGAADFDAVGPLAEGMAPFRKQGRLGFIDANGAIAIPARLDGVGQFYHGLAFAQLNGKRGVINSSGEFVLDPKFQNVRFFVDGVFCVARNGRWGLLDASGRFLLEPRCLYIGSPSEGLALLDLGDSSGRSGPKGFINEQGQIAIPPQYAEAGDFHYGLATACRPEGGCGYIDGAGAFIIPPTFSDFYSLSDFKEGLAKVSDSTGDGFIDTDGNTTIPMQFENSFDFSRVDGGNDEETVAPNYTWN